MHAGFQWGGGGGKTKEISMKNIGVKVLTTNRLIWVITNKCLMQGGEGFRIFNERNFPAELTFSLAHGGLYIVGLLFFIYYVFYFFSPVHKGWRFSLAPGVDGPHHCLGHCPCHVWEVPVSEPIEQHGRPAVLLYPHSVFGMMGLVKNGSSLFWNGMSFLYSFCSWFLPVDFLKFLPISWGVFV